MKKTKSYYKKKKYHKNYKRDPKARYNRSNLKRNNIKIITSNKFLLPTLFILFAVSNYSAAVSKYFDIPIFIIATAIVVKGTWFLMKRIDRLNLESDLSCWGLRVVGGILFLAGLVVCLIAATAITFTLAYSGAFYMFILVFPIIGLSIIVLGLFSEFRSFRRYGYFVYMR